MAGDSGLGNAFGERIGFASYSWLGGGRKQVR